VLEVGKPDDRVSKGVWRFHTLSMHYLRQSVKYVITVRFAFLLFQ
jgi:hypothetical protein